MKFWMIGKTSIRIHNVAWLYFNMRKVNITGVIDIPAVLEVLSIVLEIEKESFFY